MPTFGPLNITTRQEKGHPLTLKELDDNFTEIASYVAGLDFAQNIFSVLADSYTNGIDISIRDDDKLEFTIDFSEAQASSFVSLFEGQTGIAVSHDAVDNKIDLNIDFSEFDTDSLLEGTVNLFFTDDRADARILEVFTNSILKENPVSADTLLLLDSTDGQLKKVSTENFKETVGYATLSSLEDTADIDYAEGSLLVGNGTLFAEMILSGDASLSVAGSDAFALVNRLSSSSNSNVFIQHDNATQQAWLMRNKVDTANTYENLPIVGFKELSGVETPTADLLGSGIGGFAYNKDTLTLWIRTE